VDLNERVSRVEEGLRVAEISANNPQLTNRGGKSIYFWMLDHRALIIVGGMRSSVLPHALKHNTSICFWILGIEFH